MGTALIEAVKAIAIQSGCRRLFLITTNDNTPALRFYQRRGFVLAALHKGAVLKSRKIKPEIPLTGIDDIPIRDEIELEIDLIPIKDNARLLRHPQFGLWSQDTVMDVVLTSLDQTSQQRFMGMGGGCINAASQPLPRRSEQR